MTIQQRPVPLHPPVTTFAVLAAWLVRRIDNLDADCNDEETQQSIGIRAVDRSRATVAALRDVLHAITPAVETETAEQMRVAGEDGLESAWKDAGYHSSIEVWQGESR